jgi:hypothetical protein
MSVIAFELCYKCSDLRLGISCQQLLCLDACQQRGNLHKMKCCSFCDCNQTHLQSPA